MDFTFKCNVLLNSLIKNSIYLKLKFFIINEVFQYYFHYHLKSSYPDISNVEQNIQIPSDPGFSDNYFCCIFMSQ